MNSSVNGSSADAMPVAAYARMSTETQDHSIQHQLDAINQYIVTREPWRRHKEQGVTDALSRILWNTLEAFRIVSIMLSPVMPKITAQALERLGAAEGQVDGDVQVEEPRRMVRADGA